MDLFDSMLSTESLRKDHLLIEKMLKALGIASGMLEARRSIPPPILYQVIDFTKNFTLICHHGKEESSLFPALERSGMPREGGPIARMLFEREVTKQLATKMENSTHDYLQSGNQDILLADIKNHGSCCLTSVKRESEVVHDGRYAFAAKCRTG